MSRRYATWLLLPLRRRDGEVEGRPLAGLGGRPDAAAVALDDAAAGVEPQAGARHLRPQALEGEEDRLRLRGIDAGAVVDHREDPMAVGARRRDGDPRRLRAAVLDGVRDEVLEEEDDLGR